MMRNLIIRTISALVYVGLFIFAILFSYKTFVGLVFIFAFISLWEFQKIINVKNIIPSFLLILFSFLAVNQYISYRPLLTLLIITLLCSFYLLFFLFKKEANYYPKLVFDKYDSTIRYIILPFCFLMILPMYKGIYNPHIVLNILILIWINDTFAYLTGRLFGKHKLLERISPKKTIEGFIGGVIFSIIGSFVFRIYYPEFNYHWIIIGIIVAVFGTLGDLVESKFKRQANIKDSGNIMPGHGGLLDRLDSLIFVSPFVYLYVHFVI